MATRRRNPKEIMLNMPVWKALFTLSWPTILASTVMALSNLIDMVFLGRTIGVKAIGGLAVVFPLQLIFLGVGQGIASGGSSIISRAFGADDESLARKTFAHVLMIIVFVSLIFFLAMYQFLPEILTQFGATKAILPLAVPFARITILGYFLYGLSLALNATVRAEGYTIPSMISRVFTVVVKIFMTWLLVVNYNMGMTGAALATVLSHFVAVAFLSVEMIHRQSALLFQRVDCRLDRGLVKRILSLSTSTFIIYGAGTVTSIVMNRTIAASGSAVHLAIYGVIHRIRVFLYTPILGLNQGLAPLVGFNIGSGRTDRIKKAFTLSVFAAVTLLMLLTIVFQLFPSEIMTFFARGARFERAGDFALRTSTMLILLTSFPIIMGTLTLSLGHAGLSSLLSLSRQILFFIPMGVILNHFMGVKGIWYAYVLSDVSSFVLGLGIAIYIFHRLPPPTLPTEPAQVPDSPVTPA